jgi:hypothetical protein
LAGSVALELFHLERITAAFILMTSCTTLHLASCRSLAVC